MGTIFLSAKPVQAYILSKKLPKAPSARISVWFRICPLYRQLSQPIHGAVEHVEIYPAANSVHTAGVGMLPKAPSYIALRFIYIIMSQPQRVFPEASVGKVFFPKISAGIENWLHVVLLLHPFHPLLPRA